MKQTTTLSIRHKNVLLDHAGNPLAAFSSNAYKGADYNRYNQDFTLVGWDPNQLVALSAEKLRNRAQDLERNSDHVRRFLAIVESNVIGQNGIRLQSKATRSEATETPDRQAIRLIETDWIDWADNFACVNGEDSWVDVSKMLTRRRIVDGEVFLEMLTGFDNEYRFAVRVWGAEACPMGHSDVTQSIYNGIKYDAWGRKASYFFHPEGYAASIVSDASKLIEIPADRVIHLFRRERPFQRRGISELCSTAERLNMLDKFERATLIGAQIASSKMGFFRDPPEVTTPTYTGDGPEATGTGPNVIDIQPGQFEDIGKKLFEAFEPEYPPAKYEEFVHEILRSAASGLNLSYHIFANDPKSVNYSTAREFRLQDTDAWRDHQGTFIRKVCGPVFRAWMGAQLLRPFGRLSRYKPASDRKRLSFVKWQPRGWQWVDPQKEANGNMLAIQMGVKSLSDVAAEQGRDFEEVIEQIQRDREYADAHEVDLSAIWAAQVLQPDPNEDREDKDDPDDPEA